MAGMRRARPVLLAARGVAAAERDGIRALLSGRATTSSRCVASSIPTWSIEITLESPDEALRKRNGKFPWPMRSSRRTIERALAHGCRKLDVFFMTGLPGQRYEDALAIADYASTCSIASGSTAGLHPFVAPLGPFLDPGCRAFEEPTSATGGSVARSRTITRPFLHDGWHQILSYETDGMTRDEIVRATYDVAERLNDLKRRHGLIDRRDVRRTCTSAWPSLGARGRAAADDILERRRRRAGEPRTMFGDDELKWPVRQRLPHRTDAAAESCRRPRPGIRTHGCAADGTVRRVAGGALTRPNRRSPASAVGCHVRRVRTGQVARLTT